MRPQKRDGLEMNGRGRESEALGNKIGRFGGCTVEALLNVSGKFQVTIFSF
jgi:hypothetical protein